MSGRVRTKQGTEPGVNCQSVNIAVSRNMTHETFLQCWSLAPELTPDPCLR